MKKFLLTIVAIIMMTMCAQAQHYYIHYTNEGTYRWNFRSVMSSDDCLIFDESLFDAEDNEMGVRFLKVNRESGFVDSLYLDDIMVNASCMLARNPLVDDGNVYFYFSRDTIDNAYYYNAIFFNDNMELTQRLIMPVPIDGDMKYRRYHMEPSGDFLVSWRNATLDTCRFARFGLDGTLKRMSEPVSISASTKPSLNPWFVIDDEPLRMGFLNCSDNITVLVFDSDFNFEEPRTIGDDLVAYMWAAINSTQAIGMGDGNFAIIVDCFPPYIDRNRTIVGKYNGNFQRLARHVIEYKNPSPYFTNHPVTIDKINGGLYVIGYNFETSRRNMSATVQYLNSDLELIWDKGIVKGQDIMVYAAQPMETGGAVFSGCTALPGQACTDHYVFACYVDPDYVSTEEIQQDGNPFVCYPNPAGNTLNISFAQDLESQSVEIHSLDGRLVETFPETSENTTLDISNLTAGVYIMKVKLTDGKEFTEKLIKNQ